MARTTTRLYNQPLASEGDWSAYADLDKTGFVYYFNAVTGESLWEKPTDTFPDVVLTGTIQLQAQRKQEEYLKQTEGGGDSTSNAKPEKKGFLQAILETPAEPVQPRRTSSSSSPTAAVVEENKNSNDGGWFGVGGGGGIKEKKDDNWFTLGGGTKDKDKAKEQDNWFSSLTSSSSSSSSTTTGTTDQSTAKKEEDNWFGSIFTDNVIAAAEATKEKPMVVEEKPQKVEPEPFSAGGLFGGMFQPPKEKKASSPNGVSASVSAASAMLDRMMEVTTAATTTATTTTTEPSTVVEAPIQIQSAAYVLPHPAKVRWGGEDAVFTRGRTFGVFDGVSGAEKLDGVPLYSKTLADEMKRLIASDDESLNIQELTKRLTRCAETADRTATGASTAVVACIGADGFLRALNVGDSACIVIRNNRVVARTREISHYFECPYQLSVDSPDRPRDGTKLNLELQRGDLVLMASDGIFDNLNDDQICEIVAAEKTPTAMAKRVTELSRKVSLDDSAPTPYAKLAKRFGDPDYPDGLGGKVDDVSCIVVSYK